MKRLLFLDGENYTDDMPEIVRTAVRGVIFADGKLLLIEDNKNEVKLPGGGREEGETDIETLIREVREETGCTVIPETVRPFGYIEEKRKGFNEDMIWHQFSRLYFCRVTDERSDTEYSENEKKRGMRFRMYTIDEAIAKNSAMLNNIGKLAWNQREYRTLLLIKAYLEKELENVFSLFFDETPTVLRTIDTSLDEADFRMTFIVETASGGKYVIKLADNDFTFPEKIAVWQRTVEEYRKLGCYCPRIIGDKSGNFPIVDYHGHRCAAYCEEFAPYDPAEERSAENFGQNEALYNSYKRDIWKMTARIAARYFDYTEYPSAYCLFETFCPSDKTDEVLENALEWKKYADTLPDEFRERTERIWRLWTENRAALEPIYKKLPTSVFQADLNESNVLLDGEGRFVGVYDFNLCGREVFLNYLMRENGGVSGICEALKIASEYYRFSDIEKNAALLLYRCLKPLWYTRVTELKEAGSDREAIRRALDETEHALTDPIDFTAYME